MKKRQASGTAQLVAYQRALGNLAPAVPGFFDPVAEQLLPEKWKKKIEKVKGRLPGLPFPFWLRGMGIFNQLWNKFRRDGLHDRSFADKT